MPRENYHLNFYKMSHLFSITTVSIILAPRAAIFVLKQKRMVIVSFRRNVPCSKDLGILYTMVSFDSVRKFDFANTDDRKTFVVYSGLWTTNAFRSSAFAKSNFLTKSKDTIVYRIPRSFERGTFHQNSRSPYVFVSKRAWLPMSNYFTCNYISQFHRKFPHFGRL